MTAGGAADAVNLEGNAFDPQVGPFQIQAYGILGVRVGALHQSLDVSAYVLHATNKDPVVGVCHSFSCDRIVLRPSSGP